jgi:cytochrome c
MSTFRSQFFIPAVAALAAPALCAAGPKPDVEHGKATFAVMCSVCHSTVPSGGPTVAPNLLGVVGRKAGSQPDFAQYTPALKASGITWSVKTLDKFLIAPWETVPGTAMPMLIPDNKTRADVVAYLATLKP